MSLEIKHTLIVILISCLNIGHSFNKYDSASLNVSLILKFIVSVQKLALPEKRTDVSRI